MNRLAIHTQHLFVKLFQSGFTSVKQSNLAETSIRILLESVGKLELKMSFILCSIYCW